MNEIAEQNISVATTSMEQGSSLILIIGLILLLLVGTLITINNVKKSLDKKKLLKDEAEQKKQLKEKIQQKIIDLKREFKEEAIAYSLRGLLLDSSLSREDKKELLQSYDKVLSQPRIKWDNFTITGEEGNILDEILNEKIKDFAHKKDYTIKDAFKFMLLEEAKEEAMKIIEEEENSK